MIVHNLVFTTMNGITFYANWDKDSKNVFEFFHTWNQDFIDYDRRILDLPGTKERKICRKNEEPDTFFKAKLYNANTVETFTQHAVLCFSREVFDKESIKFFWENDIMIAYNNFTNSVTAILSKNLVDEYGTEKCLNVLTGREKLVKTNRKQNNQTNTKDWPTKFIFNKDMTIAFWSDGTKTFAKYNPDSSTWRDPMIGALICMLKHYTGTGTASRLHDIFDALDEIDGSDIEDYGVVLELNDGRPKKVK